MLHSRRSQPTPLDFEHALRQFSLPTASLEPHLKHPIPTSKVRIRLDTAPDKTAIFEPAKSALNIVSGELSGEPDKNARQYIPKHFPAFPSKHTYKWTEQEPKRETDARKIREEASVQARQGEDALRRLTAVSKAGKEKGVKQAAGKDPKSKQRHDLWEQTMSGLLASKQTEIQGMGDVDKSMIVNANKTYHRKGAITKRKQVPQLPADIFST
jgi:transcription initiation factor TFIID subunit 8